MPAVIPLIAMGAGIVANKLSSDSQAKAVRNATQVQVNATHEAMDYQREQQARAMDYAERMRTMPMQGPQPGGAQSYLSRLMGIPGGNSFQGAPPMASSAGYQYRPAMGAAASGTGAGPNLGYAGLMGAQMAQSVGSGSTPAAMAQGGGTVMIQAPNGERQAVPAADAAHYLSLPGARRIG